MRTKWTLLALAAAAGIALHATIVRSADLQPMFVSSLSGTLRIQQPIPCSGHIDHSTPVTAGRLEISPAQGVDVAGGGKLFSLLRANLTFAAFTVTGECWPFSETDAYGAVYVQLNRAVSFTALPAGPDLYSFTIPADSFRIQYETTVDGSPESGVKVARDPVTGTIDLASGIVQVRAVLATRVTFRAGCTDVFGCPINETHDGSLTANITGRITFPDTDRDGVPDRTDNCRFTPNPDQTPVPTPTIAAPPAVTLTSCLSRGFGRATAADVCNNLPVTIASDAPLQFDLGANAVTWRALDSVGRVATAGQTVTIVDRTPPSFTSVPANIALTNCGPASLGVPTATDDCAGTPAFSNDAPAIFYVGSTPVTWTATDASGNIRTAVQTVDVTDTVAPTVSCVATSPTGSAVRVSASDACAAATTLRLGTFVLAEGETIHINETGRPGVRLVNVVGPNRIRHFHVGPGEGIVTATDGAGNVATAVCPVR